jgi:hypothetical protein
MNTTAFVRACWPSSRRPCSPAPPSPDRTANRVARRSTRCAATWRWPPALPQLDEMAQRDGSRVLLIARAGQDLSKYGLRYSHLGIAYRDDAALGGRGAWRVVHKLNQCGSSRSDAVPPGPGRVLRRRPVPA